MISVFTAGGTIDKVYFDAHSDYAVGESKVDEILAEANVDVPYELKCILKKDSLDLTDSDRQVILETIGDCDNRRILLTHGTDTMVETARFLKKLSTKIIVLTGSMAPARFRASDAVFNIGFAFAAVQTLDNGIYIAMNGQVFNPDEVVKDRKLVRFVKKVIEAAVTFGLVNTRLLNSRMNYESY